MLKIAVDPGEGGAGFPQVHVVRNLVDELKARVPAN